MSRMLLDDDLREWEVYADTGRFGLPDHARLMFRCTSDPDERTRSVAIEGDKSDAEAFVAERSDAELEAMKERAEPLD